MSPTGTGQVDPLDEKFEKSPYWQYKEDNVVVMQAKNNVKGAVGGGQMQLNSSAKSLKIA